MSMHIEWSDALYTGARFYPSVEDVADDGDTSPGLFLTGGSADDGLMIYGDVEDIRAALTRALAALPGEDRPLVTIYLPADPRDDGTHYRIVHHVIGDSVVIDETGDIYAELAGVLDDAFANTEV